MAIVFRLFAGCAICFTLAQAFNRWASQAFDNILDRDDDSLSYNDIVALAQRNARVFDALCILFGLLGFALLIISLVYGAVQLSTWLR
jgi:uncharacterized membrane protein